MRFCSLGSGSSGNATVVEAGHGAAATRVLIDCGFSLRELEFRLQRAGLEVAQLSAVFVTHEHADHVGCCVSLARRHGVPLWMSRGTWRALDIADVPEQLRFARDGETIDIGALQLLPYTVPHDALEPLQLCCTDGATRLGMLTDAGSTTPHLQQSLQDCHALLLECNHDRALLAASHYPASLKQRIGGRLGHLANDVAAQILAEVHSHRLQHLVAAHLSEVNNRPVMARAALSAAVGAAASEVIVADPRTGFDWLTIR